MDRGEHGYVLDGLGKLVDGWLDTGDLAHLDAEGFIHLHGRAKDLIVATIELDRGSDEGPVAEVLGRYAIEWKVGVGR